MGLCIICILFYSLLGPYYNSTFPTFVYIIYFLSLFVVCENALFNIAYKQNHANKVYYTESELD